MRLVERPEMCLILFIMRNGVGIGTHLWNWGWSRLAMRGTHRHPKTLPSGMSGSYSQKGHGIRSDATRTFSELWDAADPWHDTVPGCSPMITRRAHTIAGQGAA